MSRKPLYVRLPEAAADKLDRAAFESRTAKQDIVAGLVDRYLDIGFTRRIVVEQDDDSVAVGHHSFVPTDAPEVLTLTELATLLRVDEDVATKLAESGELPGRKLAGEWRFSRTAVLKWMEEGA